MAIYEYEILNTEGTVVGIYETEQKMSEDALTQHPVTGQPLRRILSATFAHGSRADSASSCASGSCPIGGGFDTNGCCGAGGCGLN
jgi:predicted nucleic acid-binding Zn ribbon protein